MMRTNAPSRPENAAAAIDDDRSFDTSILAFGGSASFNTDVRRSIKKEVEMIDASIAKTKKESKVEKAVADDLIKGLAHAVRESRTLTQRSEQTVDALKLIHEVAQGVKKTVLAEILVSSSEASNQHGNPGNEDLSSTTTTTTPARTLAGNNRKGMAITKETFQKNYGIIQEATGNLRELTRKKKDIEADSSTELGEEYAQRLTAVTVNCSSVTQVWKDEEDRVAALNATEEKGNQKVTDFLAEMDQLSKQVAFLKLENFGNENEKRKEADMKRESLDRVQKKLADAEARCSNLITLKERFDLQIEKAEELIQHREQQKCVLESERQARNKLFSEKRELGSQLLAYKKEHDGHVRTIVKEEELKRVIEAEKAANDEIEETRYAQATSEAKEIQKELEMRKNMIMEMERNEKKVAVEKEIEDMLQLKDKIQQELNSLMADLERMREKQATITDELHRYKSSVEQIKQLEADADALRRKLADLKTSLLASRADLRAEIARKRYAVRFGASMLQKVAEKEKKVEAQ